MSTILWFCALLIIGPKISILSGAYTCASANEIPAPDCIAIFAS